jgi:hypothetical protein
MLLDLIVDNVWLALLLWMGLYISDYALTLRTARLYQGGGNQHVLYEKGIELTPYYRGEIAALRNLSPRFLFMLGFSSLLLWLIWFLGQLWGPDSLLFEMVIGAYLLLEVSVHMRHIRNLAYFGYLKGSRGVRGKIEYSAWLTLRISTVDLVAFAVLFLVVFLLTGRLFFAGGALGCAVTGFKHWQLARKEKGTI